MDAHNLSPQMFPRLALIFIAQIEQRWLVLHRVDRFIDLAAHGDRSSTVATRLIAGQIRRAMLITDGVEPDPARVIVVVGQPFVAGQVIAAFVADQRGRICLLQ